MTARSGSLAGYVVTRLLLVIPMVLILLTLVFGLMRIASGDPVTAALGGRLSPAELAEKRAAAGYDKPIVVQYVDYLGNVVTGDLGTTLSDNRPVTEVLAQNGAATLELTLCAMLVAIAAGLPLGLLAARRRDSSIDVVSRLYGIVVYATPVFFLGLLAQLLFGRVLGVLPMSGQSSVLTQAELIPHTNVLVLDAAIQGRWDLIPDLLSHLVLPAATLGLVVSGVILRLVRVNVIQTLRAGYVEAAHARGVRERTILTRHALRNALVPIVTVIGLQAALLLSGAILTERTFNWPGIGNQLVGYVTSRDYPAVQGIITIFALVVVVVSLLIDLIAAWVDPRVRYE